MTHSHVQGVTQFGAFAQLPEPFVNLEQGSILLGPRLLKSKWWPEPRFKHSIQ